MAHIAIYSMFKGKKMGLEGRFKWCYGRGMSKTDTMCFCTLHSYHVVFLYYTHLYSHHVVFMYSQLPCIFFCTIHSIIGKSCHKYHFCCAKTVIVKTHVCCDKHVCHDKTRLLLRQKYASHDKHIFVMTKVLSQQIFATKNNFVMTILLLQ